MLLTIYFGYFPRLYSLANEPLPVMDGSNPGAVVGTGNTSEPRVTEIPLLIE